MSSIWEGALQLHLPSISISGVLVGEGHFWTVITLQGGKEHYEYEVTRGGKYRGHQRNGLLSTDQAESRRGMIQFS